MADPTSERLLEGIQSTLNRGIPCSFGLVLNIPDVFEKYLAAILKEIQDMAVTIKDVLAKVQAQTTVVTSVTTLLAQISQMLKDAQANNDPAATQAVIDLVDANTKALADASAANTPGGPVTPPTPTPTP